MTRVQLHRAPPPSSTLVLSGLEQGFLGEGGAVTGATAFGSEAFGVAEVGSANPNTWLFNGDFATGNTSQYGDQAAGQGLCAPDRAFVYDGSSIPAGAPSPRLIGTHVCRFRCLNTDVNPCTWTGDPRAQLYNSNLSSALVLGATVWQAWSLYLPTTFPLMPDSNWYQFQEDYGGPAGTPAPFAWYIAPKNGVNWIMIQGQLGFNDTYLVPCTPGHWMDFLVYKVLKADATGQVQAWINGTEAYPLTSRQTVNAGSGPIAFTIGSYRQLNQYVGTIDTFFALPRVGISRQSVEILGGTR